MYFSEYPDLGRATLPLGKVPVEPPAWPADKSNKERNRISLFQMQTRGNATSPIGQPDIIL